MIVRGEQSAHVEQTSTNAPTDIRSWFLLVVTVLILILLVAGQWFVGNQQHAAIGLILFGIASLLFFLPPLAAGRVQVAETPAVESRVNDRFSLVRSSLWRAFIIFNSALLAVLAYLQFAGNRLDAGFWYWLGSILYFLLAFAERPEGGWKRRLERHLQVLDWRTVAALAMLTVLAIFFRTYRLVEVPAEMTSDHAEKLLDVHDVLNGLRPIFFPRNTGREAVQFYVTAALIRFTPFTLGHLALKVGTALFGIITVPLTYFLSKHLFGRAVGLLTTFFLAISHWHVAITRVGLRFPFTAAFAVPALLFLLRALRHNRRNDWLAAGLVLGIGLHTYTAMRIVPLLFIVLVVFKAGADVWQKWRRREAQTVYEEATTWDLRFWFNAVLSALTALLLFLPLLRFMRDEPEIFWYRAMSRAEAPMSAGELWRGFWLNTKNALLMFNFKGDVVPANTIPGEPQLGYITGGLFVMGIAYLMWRLLRYHERTAAYTLLCFFTLLLPSILSLAYPRENPSAVRSGGAVPFVMMIAALPLVVMGRRLLNKARANILALAAFTLLLILGFATIEDYHWYFIRYDEHYRRSSWNASEMGQVIRDFVSEGGDMQNVYHVPFPHWVDTRNIAITAGDITWRNAVMDLAQVNEHVTLPGAKLYIIHPSDNTALKLLQVLYPQATLRRYESTRPGKDFLLLYVPET